MFYYVFESIDAWVCVSAGACGLQKKVPDPLDLELQAIVSRPAWVLKSNPSSLQVPNVLLTAKPSPQSLIKGFRQEILSL